VGWGAGGWGGVGGSGGSVWVGGGGLVAGGGGGGVGGVGGGRAGGVGGGGGGEGGGCFVVGGLSLLRLGGAIRAMLFFSRKKSARRCVQSFCTAVSFSFFFPFIPYEGDTPSHLMIKGGTVYIYLSDSPSVLWFFFSPSRDFPRRWSFDPKTGPSSLFLPFFFTSPPKRGVFLPGDCPRKIGAATFITL